MREISSTLGISKSTASLWLRSIELTNSQRKQLSQNPHSLETIEKRRTSRMFNDNLRRQVYIDQAAKDITSISKKELKIIGTMLYWAEGRKRGQRIVTFSNSDSTMVKTIMRFFREICNVKDEKFRCQIHIYTNGNTKLVEKYWSGISGIPLKQFYKTYAQNSIASKGIIKTLPMGTLDINVCDAKLFLKIMGWIEKVRLLTN